MVYLLKGYNLQYILNYKMLCEGLNMVMLYQGDIVIDKMVYYYAYMVLIQHVKQIIQES